MYCLKVSFLEEGGGGGGVGGGGGGGGGSTLSVIIMVRCSVNRWPYFQSEMSKSLPYSTLTLRGALTVINAMLGRLTENYCLAVKDIVCWAEKT